MDAIKPVMTKGSHFDLISGADLKNTDIVQIIVPQAYENNAGYAVFLCEVRDNTEERM